VEAARRHYPETVLITDRPGKALLVDQLGLPFVQVSTELDRLEDVDPGWWALGKLVAYGMQDRPFVHIDSDVFLWKPLPGPIAAAPVFAQFPEYWPDANSNGLGDVERAFAQDGVALPIEWEWVRSRGEPAFREENCGILGGSDLEFLRYYSRTAIDLVQDPKNAPPWSRLPDKSGTMILIEQFWLSACLEFHRFHPSSPYRGVKIRHLFPTWEQASNPNQAALMGFTHLMGGAKSHPAVGRRLEERVRREDPVYFRRCERVLANLH
jgi:hypothetical protein